MVIIPPMFPDQEAGGRRPAGSGFRRLPIALGEERGLWQIATAAFCVFAVLKGLGAPNNWALTQAQLDYRHGFIKRGLRGEIFHLLHAQQHIALSVVFFAELAILFLLLAEFIRRSQVQERFGSLAPVTVFASSYAVTALTCLAGYTDIFLAASLVGLLLVRRERVRFWLALPVLPLALLVHENFLLMCLPVLLFSFVPSALREEGGARLRALLRPVTLATLAVTITLLFAVRANVTPEQSRRYESEIRARADFEVHPEVFRVLERPLKYSVLQAWIGLHQAQWTIPDAITLANLLPPTLFFLYLIRKMVRRGPLALHQEADRQAKALLWGTALAAVLAPLAMYALGFDGGRWNTAAALSAFLVWLILCRDLPLRASASLRLSTTERNVAVLLLAFNMATGFGVFNGGSTNPFPFVPAVSEDYR